MTIEQRAIKWLLGDDTGTSSKTICAVMMGYVDKARGYYYHPCDASDLGRCKRLLDLIPEWRPRLQEVADMFPRWQNILDEGKL